MLQLFGIIPIAAAFLDEQKTGNEEKKYIIMPERAAEKSENEKNCNYWSE